MDLAGEPTKHGAPADAWLSLFEAAASCRAARVTGLMLLPPFFDVAAFAAAGETDDARAAARALVPPPSSPRLVSVAMMREGDKLTSYLMP